jgi:ATP/maltotriose-dependent transcriptional regulator MalT
MKMNATRRSAILEAYSGHVRRFDKIMSTRQHPVLSGAVVGSEPAPEVEPGSLSERQLEVLALVAEGLSNPEISAAVDVGLETVKTHILHILQRLGARSRAHAVGIGYQRGLLS